MTVNDLYNQFFRFYFKKAIFDFNIAKHPTTHNIVKSYFFYYLCYIEFQIILPKYVG